MSNYEPRILSPYLRSQESKRDGLFDAGRLLSAGLAQKLESFMASGLGSRGGPNKLSNKWMRTPGTYSLHDPKKVVDFLATGLGSRGGPNKISNKLRSSPVSYVQAKDLPQDYLIGTSLRSRGGPNKVSNKLKRSPASYFSLSSK